MCIVALTSRFWGQGLWGSQAEGSMAAESPVERWVLIGGWSLGFAHLCFTCHTLVSRLQTSVSDGLQLGSLGGHPESLDGSPSRVYPNLGSSDREL